MAKLSPPNAVSTLSAYPLHLEVGIEPVRKRRNVGHRNVPDPSIAAGRPHPDQPGRRLDHEIRNGSRISARPVSIMTVATHIAFEPDMGGVSSGSHDDPADVRLRTDRRNQEVTWP